MSAIVFCEAALYGLDGKELDHPDYKRQTVQVSVEYGFKGNVSWSGLDAAKVALFRLLILESVLIESGVWVFQVDGRDVVGVRLDIPGKKPRLPLMS